jgi:tellurite methyltransferase
MKSKNNWEQYYKNTEERPPRRSLVEAIQSVSDRNFALDLGAGALQDSKYLIDNGFNQVTAVDSEETVAEQDVKNYNIEVVIKPFEFFIFPQDKFDLVNAQYSLPFISPDKFYDVFRSIINSLKQNGVFVGQFFGDRDDWNKNTKMTFLTKEGVNELFKDVEIIKLEEKENDGKTAAGQDKHWHIFDFVVKKQPDPDSSN